MGRTFSRSAILALLLLPLCVAAQGELPKVLVLGDQVQRNLFSAVGKDLKDQVQIELPSVVANDTGTALNKIDELLGDTKWDVIYFNYGLGDLFYKDPKSTEIRAMSKYSGGMRVSSPEQYGKNLEQLAQRLKATGAKLIWASTTPMVTVNAFPGYMGNMYDPNSEIEYNKIAASVMKRHGIPINDMHTFVLAQFGPEEKHPGHTGYQKHLSGFDRGKKRKDWNKQPMRKPIVEAILKQAL